MHKILVIRLYFLLNSLHVSGYISPYSGATISYEIRSAFILLSFVVFVCSYDLVYIYFFQVYL